MPTAEDVFSETFGRFTRNWTVISSLRQVTELGLPYAEEALAGVHAEFMDHVATDPDYKKIFVSIDGSDTPLSQQSKEFIRSGMTESAINNARSAVDAASLVFAQSILDDCACSYCRVCAIANPKDWEPLVDTKKIDFGALREKSTDRIREELISAKLAQLERESLLTKVDLLFRLCPPPEDFAPIRNYSFDRDRLERIDGDRHRIIHGNGLVGVVATIEEDLEFIQKTANYLMGLVNEKYGIKLHPLKVLGLRLP